MSETGITQTVVATPYGERFHELKDGQRAKHAACGGFIQTNLFTLPKGEALEQGYSACNNCYSETGIERSEGSL